jgi:GNAT superfamily N-acetyltransferase
LDSDGAELGWAVVLPEERGHGIGTTLAIHAARELAARRIPLIYGFVSEKNAHQIAHWGKLGARRGRTFLLCERSLA